MKKREKSTHDGLLSRKRRPVLDQRLQHFTQRTLSETLAILDVEAIADHAQQHRRTPRLLDVACGTGILLSLLHQRFPDAELYGVDSSQDMLALAQKRLSGVQELRLAHTIVGPSAQVGLPFPADSFDLITCTNALHAMPDPVATLAGFRRLLAPFGQLLLEDYARRPPPFPWWLIERLTSLIVEGHVHPYTLAETRSLCEQAGLCIRASRAFVIDWLMHGWVIHIVNQ